MAVGPPDEEDDETERALELAAAYEAAFDEWTASGEAELWEVTVGDGIDDLS